MTDASTDEEAPPSTADLLSYSWRQAAADGDHFCRLFYAIAFDMAGPVVADLFPVAMADQRRKLMAVLGHVVRAAAEDQLEAAVPELHRLGADHRRYGTMPEHYDTIGRALVAALDYVVDGWTDAHAEAWTTAYGAASGEMRKGASRVHQLGVPAYIDLAVVSVEGLDRVVVWVEVPLGVPLQLERAAAEQAPVNVARTGRAGGWIVATVTEHLKHGDRERAAIAFDVADTDTDAIAIATTPIGEALRFAPVYPPETTP